MTTPEQVVDDVWALASYQPAPGHGVLPVNAFLFGEKPAVLVDTGLPSEQEAFFGALWSLVRPSDLDVVFLTHEDADHAGNALAVLDAAPQARLVTNYVTVAKLLERMRLPLDRVQVVNPGERVPGTSRILTAFRPPLYDAPGTLGLHDAATGAAITVDAFGTYLPEQEGVAEDDVLSGLVTFNRLNHPWVGLVDATRFGRAVDAVAGLHPSALLSSHARPFRDDHSRIFGALRGLAGTEPYRPPDQPGFERLRDQLAGP